MGKDRIKKHFLIGIDTAHNKNFSYISFGSNGIVNQLRTEIDYLCLRNGIKKTHFCDIDLNKRKIIYPEIVNLALKYHNLNLYVLEHRKPTDYDAKDFYLHYLPEEYARFFNFLKNRTCVIRVDVHDDFGVSGVENSTYHLLDSLARKFTELLADEPNIFRDKENAVLCKIKCKETGNKLLFSFRKSIGQNSAAIVVADMIIGFHQLKFRTGDKIFSRTKLDNNFLRRIYYKNIIP